MALSVGSFIIFVLVLGILVFVHELGHFLVTKWWGVNVEEFGFGIPPRLAGAVKGADRQWHFFWGQNAPKPEVLGGPATIYSLNWIPVGGFVRPQGEDNPGVSGGLAAAPKRARFTVMLAGATFNLLFAFLVFTLGFSLGWPKIGDTGVQIMGVAAGSPAEAAGLQVDDVVQNVDGQVITSSTFISYTHSHLGQPIRLALQRNGATLTVTVTPRTTWPSSEGPMGIEIGQPYSVVSYSLPSAMGQAAGEIYFQFDQLIHLPGALLRHEVPVQAARPIGLVGMNDLTRMAVKASEQANALYPLIQLIGTISVALAITNLLPLPGLDGGRILFVLIEAVRGRRVDPAHEGMVHMAGLLVLLMLMAVITYNDIFYPIFPR
jgi:regulator of sigma E protease